jgi:hypothetical protein
MWTNQQYNLTADIQSQFILIIKYMLFKCILCILIVYSLKLPDILNLLYDNLGILTDFICNDY